LRFPRSVPSARRRSSRGAAALVLAASALLLCAGPAFADSATLTVTDTAGQPDAASGLPRVFTVSGTSAVKQALYVKYRAPGGAPCAPTAYSDSGTILDEFWGVGVNGSFSTKNVYTWRNAGDVMFCVWLAKDNGTVTTPIAQTVSFRAPTGSVSATVGPVTPKPLQQTTVTVTGTSEAPAVLWAKIRPAGGAACGVSYAGDAGTELINGRSVNGTFTTQVTTTPQAAGNYLICLWIARSSDDPNPIAGPQAVTFSVVAPCVVPKIAAGTSVTSAKRKIVAAHCRVGQTTKVYSRTRKGRVVSLSTRAGKSLPNGTKINLKVSRGKRH